MNKKVAFIVKHFTERGTELSTYNYAKYNESLLSNQSIIIAFNKASKDNKKGLLIQPEYYFQKNSKLLKLN